MEGGFCDASNMVEKVSSKQKLKARKRMPIVLEVPFL